MIKKYNKLIRDNIPSIIEKDNKKANIRILSDEEYLIELNKKLTEELKEYLVDNEVKELADIQEVIYAILNAKNVSLKEFEAIRLSKVKSNGAFKNKIFLESVEDDE